MTTLRERRSPAREECGLLASADDPLCSPHHSPPLETTILLCALMGSAFSIPHISEVCSSYVSVSGSFHLALYPPASSILSQIPGFSPFYRLSNFKFCVYICIYVQTHSLTLNRMAVRGAEPPGI